MTKRYGIHAGTGHGSKGLWLLFVGLLCVAGAITAFVLFRAEPTDAPSITSDTEQEATTEVTAEPSPTVPLVDLQPTLDAWLAGKSVDYGVEVFDIANQKVIAAHQPDKQYFTASIYKFYVAYLTYQRLQSGEYVEEANFLGSQSLLDCQHAMIYTSDSPCGEAVMAKLTQEVMGRELKAFGTTNTNFPGFVTTAHDANVMLSRLAKKQDLNEEYTAKITNSMETQIYSRGLMKGFADARVASKVGFNETINFHEIGLVTYTDGRQYAVSIFSQGQGSSAPLASLSAVLNETLKTVAPQPTD